MIFNKTDLSWCAITIITFSIIGFFALFIEGCFSVFYHILFYIAISIAAIPIYFGIIKDLKHIFFKNYNKNMISDIKEEIISFITKVDFQKASKSELNTMEDYLIKSSTILSTECNEIKKEKINIDSLFSEYKDLKDKLNKCEIAIKNPKISEELKKKALTFRTTNIIEIEKLSLTIKQMKLKYDSRKEYIKFFEQIVKKSASDLINFKKILEFKKQQLEIYKLKEKINFEKEKQTKILAGIMEGNNTNKVINAIDKEIDKYKISSEASKIRTDCILNYETGTLKDQTNG